MATPKAYFTEGTPVIIANDNTPVYRATKGLVPQDNPSYELNKGEYIGVVANKRYEHTEYGQFELVTDDRGDVYDDLFILSENLKETTQEVRKKAQDRYGMPAPRNVDPKDPTVVTKSTSQQSWFKQYGGLLIAGGLMLIIAVIVLTVMLTKRFSR